MAGNPVISAYIIFIMRPYGICQKARVIYPRVGMQKDKIIAGSLLRCGIHLFPPSPVCRYEENAIRIRHRPRFIDRAAIADDNFKMKYSVVF